MSECQTAACHDGHCGVDAVPADTPPPSQDDGDCQLLICDGNGSVQSTPDDTDTPDDGLECTNDVCADGIPVFDPLSPGTECASGVCDGSGTCVACNVPTD